MQKEMIPQKKCRILDKNYAYKKWNIPLNSLNQVKSISHWVLSLLNYKNKENKYTNKI